MIQVVDVLKIPIFLRYFNVEIVVVVDPTNTTSNRAPSLLCDSSRINRSTNKEECITNETFFIVI